MCSLGAERIRTRMTIATSPRPGLNSGLTSSVADDPAADLGAWVVREKGYDSGNVTGKLLVTGVDERLRSTARSDAGFWYSWYESSSLQNM